MSLWQHFLLYISFAIPVLLCLIYLTWEGNHYKRKNDDDLKFWERDL